MLKIGMALLSLLLCVFTLGPLRAQTAPTEIGGKEPSTEDLEAAGIEERLGEQVSIDELEFVDDRGEKVQLARYFDGEHPVILVMVYYNCPGICGHLMNGVAGSLRSLEWTIGDEFEVVMLSIDPTEDYEMAAAKKENYLNQYGRLEAEDGWHFLTGEEEHIRQLADELGFQYRFVEETGEYAHSSGLFVLTPEGVTSRVLFGIDFEKRDLRMSLLEASEGKIGSVVDRFLMYCYQYDPASRGYAIYALQLVRAGGAATLLLVGGYLGWFWLRERRRTKRSEDRNV